MNEFNMPSPVPSESANSSPQKRFKSAFLWTVIPPLLAGVFALVAYSAYVAVHEPDPQEIIIFGQSKIASGGPMGLRIVVRNRLSGKPVKGAKIELRLLGKKAPAIILGSFQTDASGSMDDPILVPELSPGEYQLAVDSESSLGRDHLMRKIEIQNPRRILLSSDKPLYQPGQTIHLRTLIFNGRSQKPVADEPVTFEITDPKGNKVFKENRKSSAFGIASADFLLASELILGRYEMRAMAGATTTERTVEIKRYVLPKFKINVTTDKPYYLPGQTVSGSIQANYFFGKPVSGGAIRLNAATFQEKPVVISELQGRTDNNGRFSFQFVLPDFFAGMPQKNEQAFLDINAEVTDPAQHAEQTTLSLSVAQSELGLAALPEAGVFVPGVENILYILTEYPDGRPAVCKTLVNGTEYQSDAQGVSQVKITPTDSNQQIEIQAVDASGRKARLQYRPDKQGPVPAFLFRTDKAVYQAGDLARVTILSPEKAGTIFLDVIKDNQTVLTRSVSLENHKAEYSLPLPPSLVGTLKVNAYVITQTGEDKGCSRQLYVNPASGLRIAADWSKPVYAPGEIARVNFSVTDPQGKPAPGALGIAAVDESVFALHENRAGLLQQFMDVESDLLKPRYQIKMFDAPERGLLYSGADQALAQAYLSSLDQPTAGPTIDDLLKDGTIDQRIIDYARNMRGTPAYEGFRNDPEYAQVIRLLEDGNGLYSLRDATGAAKVQAVEAHRKAYFKSLDQNLLAGFLGLLFLLPVFLLIYYSRPGAGISSHPLVKGQSASYLSIAISLSKLLSILTLLPLVCYPAGLYVTEETRVEVSGWILLGFETVAVALTTLLLFSRMSKVRAGDLAPELAPLRVFLGAFFTQFAVSRAMFTFVILHPWFGEWFFAEGFFFLWIIGSIIAPLLILGALNSHVRRQLKARGITNIVIGGGILHFLIVISILLLLAGLLLPALAKAKSKAVRISLLSDLKQIEVAKQLADEDAIKPGTSGSLSPRVRHDFPETLFWQPELITDDQGKVSLEIPLADSITTWRATIDAITSAGRMGSTQAPITVFQDFFVDLDLPVSMSLGDAVSVPVTCYNYLKEPQDIRLHLAPADWFESTVQDLSVHLAANEVKGASLPIKVLRVGNHSLRVTAQGSRIADAVEREIRVVPTGERLEYTKNTVLKNVLADTFIIPAEAIPDSQSLWIKAYPSRFSEIVEGLDSIFRAPYGCFEQTSSTTYPNVLVLDYMKRTGRLTPEIEVKARKFINAGYQRLLTFEVPGGGFEWFGRTPANICLTAYGILEFTDMARVHPTDEAITERARKWLFAQQKGDGSWDEIHRGWTWQGRGSMTAFVAWALAEAGDQSPNLDKALGYLRSHSQELSNTYAKALAANAFLAHDRNDSFGRELADQLKDAAIAGNNDTIHWTSIGYSMTYSHEGGMDTECTALCAMALMKAGTTPQSVKQALTWISTCKSEEGTFGSTQATILAMRALLGASTTSLGQNFDSTVTVHLNGKKVETLHINKDNSDVMQQVELTKYLHTGDNRIELQQTPAGELPIQCSGACWLPKSTRADVAASSHTDPLQIDLKYDRATLAVNDQLKCTVTVRNNTRQIVNMAIVDLGIPPGFDLDSSSFDQMRQEGQIEKFEVTGNQVILYLRELSNTTPFQFNYSLRAKYPLRVQTPRSAVYEYYQPVNRAESKATTLQVADSP